MFSSWNNLLFFINFLKKYKLDGRIENTRPLELNFTAFVRRYKLSSLLNKLPKSEALTVELNKCLGFNSQVFFYFNFKFKSFKRE